MLVVLLTAKFFIYSTPVNHLEVIKYNKQARKTDVSTDKYYSSLNFANEDIPTHDKWVKKRIKKMLKAHSYENLQTTILHRKAAVYFPIIEPILQFYGIPEDFKYLPLVESGLKGGTSPKGASGYWQFMPQTARDFGLRVDSAIDERQKIKKSTIAACKYLRSLHREFGSWTLAAAAYNIGEGSLKRQMNRQNQDDYYSMRLNRETATYVYKLISMKEIIENPKLYGYKGKAAKLLAKANVKPKKEYSHFNPIAENTALLTQQFKRN